MAAATQERRLLAVACTPMLGSGLVWLHQWLSVSLKPLCARSFFARKSFFQIVNENVAIAKAEDGFIVTC